MLRRRKVADLPIDRATWHVYEGEYDGSPLLARFDSEVGRAKDRSDYGIQIGVAVPLNDPDERGFPKESESAELAAIEELILEASPSDAVLVGVISTKSMREFVLYSQSSDWIEAFHRRLQDEAAVHEVQVMGRRDPEWAVYRQFVS